MVQFNWPCSVYRGRGNAVLKRNIRAPSAHRHRCAARSPNCALERFFIYKKNIQRQRRTPAYITMDFQRRRCTMEGLFICGRRLTFYFAAELHRLLSACAVYVRGRDLSPIVRIGCLLWVFCMLLFFMGGNVFVGGSLWAIFSMDAGNRWGNAAFECGKFVCMLLNYCLCRVFFLMIQFACM